ncbi:MAG: T9SS type A sorting domain-containing protein [Ignavibacteriae bacterium]|nr:T9SS type A sorting domain-containing protein [Ignavibacteriota bacterium]
MKQFVSFILFLLSIVPAFAQPFERQVEPFAVIAGGTPIPLPFAGGYNSPQHQFADIDGDADLDLFVFDIDQAVDFYRNEGTRFSPLYRMQNGLIALPRFLVWFLFVDYDGDGRIDLCTEDSAFSGLKVYRNTGTAQAPIFSPFISTLLDSSGQEVFAGSNSIPALTDIDNDGDLDLFSANIIGSVNFYQNIGTRTLPRYAYASGTWQNIAIFGDTCTTNANTLVSPRLHGAAAYRFADIDADGDQDFFVGDLFWTELFMVRNIGTQQSAHMECFTAHFPQGDPLVSTGFNQVSFVDVDADGDLDMFASVLGAIVQRQGFRFYQNLGTSTSHNLRLVTKEFLRTIDVGMNAHPAFVDIDADGDDDMFVGSLNGELAFFRNIGASTSPSFSLVDSAYLRFTTGFYFSPTFVDVDNDGDKDLFAGVDNGRMRFFRNIGLPQSPQFAQQPYVTDSIDVLNNSVPAFADIDNDGDKDLFVGGKNGAIRFYRNDGSASNLLLTLVSPTYAGISIGQDTYITPVFTDYDADGDFDLFFGADDGRVELYENIGSQSSAQFVRRTDRFGNTSPTQQTSPTFVDVDGDGDQDLFVGNRKGGMQFYRNNRIMASVIAGMKPSATKLFQNFPNPFNPSTAISFVIPGGGLRSSVNLTVFDLLGREVATLVDETKPSGEFTVTWDGRLHNKQSTDAPSGVYFYKLTTDNTSQVKKMLLVR